MQQKKGTARYFVIFIVLILLIAIIFFAVYLILPSLLPETPDIAKKAKGGVERVVTEIKSVIKGIEGEQIEELSPEQLPRGVLPDRSLYNLERETFNLMNQERINRGLNALEWDEGIANTAFKHSKEMGFNDYINHTNLAGQKADGRLAADRIFNICSSENIFFIEARNPKDGLAKKSVEGWIESPGHRENLLDERITIAGVGIYCEGRKCYVNANHICTTTEIEETLRERYVYFFSIYPKEIQFDSPIQINFHLEITQEADVFIVPDDEQYQNYVKRESYLFTQKFSSVLELTDTAVIERGYGFMVVPSQESVLIIEIEYL